MRISDWSSDVCSSDLGIRPTRADAQRAKHLFDIGGLRVAVGMGNVAHMGDEVGAKDFFQRGPERGDQLRRQVRHETDGVGQHHLVMYRQPDGPERRVERGEQQRSEVHTSELKSLMRTSYEVFCLKTKTTQ